MNGSKHAPNNLFAYKVPEFSLVLKRNVSSKEAAEEEKSNFPDRELEVMTAQTEKEYHLEVSVLAFAMK